MTIDPTCAFHGMKKSEHVCLFCCLCFSDLKPEECYADRKGVKWNMCRECGEMEEQYGKQNRTI